MADVDMRNDREWSQELFSEYPWLYSSTKERLELASTAAGPAGEWFCAAVSYVGKADFKEVEDYIRDFKSVTVTTTSPLLIQLSAVNGKFRLDVIQTFSSPEIVVSLFEEFAEHGIEYELQNVTKLKLPNVYLPWTEKG